MAEAAWTVAVSFENVMSLEQLVLQNVYKEHVLQDNGTIMILCGSYAHSKQRNAQDFSRSE